MKKTFAIIVLGIIAVMLAVSVVNAQQKEYVTEWHLTPIKKDTTFEQSSGQAVALETPTGKRTRVKVTYEPVEVLIPATASLTPFATEAKFGGGVLVNNLNKSSSLRYALNLKGVTSLTFFYSKGDASTGRAEIRVGSITGPVIKEVQFLPTGGWNGNIDYFKTVTVTGLARTEDEFYVTFTTGLTLGNANLFQIIAK